jgi:tetratricopeptide (TPR) repeat protein
MSTVEVPMNTLSCAIATVLLLLVFVTAVEAQSYGDELNLGAAAYKSSHYDEAIEHFRKATELDPSKTVAHLYLATALVSQYIPGVDTKDNLHTAQQAIEQYQLVLNGDGVGNSRFNSAKGIAYLYLNMKKFEDAKTYYRMASDLDPNDPEAYYSMGVVDWTESYPPRMEARAKLKLAPDQNLDASKPEEKKVCDELKAKNTPIIEEGIENLNRAIQLRPDYDDAMAYMNLMYRERADVECDDLTARADDLITADRWVDVCLQVKKQKAEKSKALQKLAAPNPQ